MKKWFALLLCGMLLLPAVSAAGAEETETADDPGFTVTLPQELSQYAYRLTDAYVNTRVSFDAEESFTLAFAAPMRGVLLAWYETPASYSLVQTDENGAQLGVETVEDGMLNRFFELDESCRFVTVTLQEPGALSGATAYPAAEELPDTLQRWNASPESVDLLLIVAEPGAEMKYFGGVLPIYAEERGIKTAVLYLSDFGKRVRSEEALAGLWSVGIRDYPIFAGFTCNNYDSYEIVESGFRKADPVKYLCAAIEALSPKVIVTHGTDDALCSVGAGARAYTSACVRKAVEKTNVVQKLYLFGETDGQAATVLDMDEPLNAYDGKTAADVAQEAFGLYASQQLYGKQIDSDGAFTLAYTSVGEDESRDDLFEHIETSSLISYAPVTPSPSPTAEPTPGPTATPAPTATAAPRAAGGGTGAAFGGHAGLICLCAGLLLTALLFAAAYRRIKTSRSAGDAVCICLIPLAAGLAACALIAGAAESAGGEPEPTIPAAAQATAEGPEQTPQPEETPASEPTPTPTLAPEEAFEANYYRKDGDPEEVVVVDEEHGHWAYRSDDLGISIDRVQTTNAAGQPVTYFLADIHMKNIDQFRPGFGSEGHTGKGSIYPWIIARRAKAVLWITGDNLVNSEKDEKGILIRDGRLFSDANVEDTLAIYPDMSMRIFRKWETRANILLDDGVENSYSFGPTLLYDGEINEDAKYHRVRRANPRAGIGYYEPGHYLAIVVDGRQKDYSVGMTVTEFAELFKENNCTLAYNLDGGLSAAMIFMGEQLNSHSGNRIGASNDISYQRAVPDGLMFGYSELVPGEDEPILNNGNKS